MSFGRDRAVICGAQRFSSLRPSDNIPRPEHPSPRHRAPRDYQRITGGEKGVTGVPRCELVRNGGSRWETPKNERDVPVRQVYPRRCAQQIGEENRAGNTAYIIAASSIIHHAIQPALFRYRRRLKDELYRCPLYKGFRSRAIRHYFRHRKSRTIFLSIRLRRIF